MLSFVVFSIEDIFSSIIGISSWVDMSSCVVMSSYVVTAWISVFETGKPISKVVKMNLTKNENFLG